MSSEGTGVTLAPAPELPEAYHLEGAAMFTSISDTVIRQKVIDELRHDVRIDSTNVTVDVIDGVVRLVGTVPTYFQKITAAHEVQRITGVCDVVNHLDVVFMVHWTDEETATIVRGNLDRDARLTDPPAIHGAVAHGVVTLTGTVATPVEMASAEEDARVAPGVIEVMNHITVTGPPRTATWI